MNQMDFPREEKGSTMSRSAPTGEIRRRNETFRFLRSPDFEPLLWPSCRPNKPSAWHGHVSFGHWLVHSCRPQVVVELGTHYGVSFGSFCNAVRRGQVPARCFAVDTWKGDSHSGKYENEVYEDLLLFVKNNFSFAELHRCEFDEAVKKFEDKSIDLLHIDGYHTYEAAAHDFRTWLPKVSESGVILFHDIAVRGGDFGVWKLWEEVSLNYPNFSFIHSAGLGVLAVGSSPPDPILSLCELNKNENMGILSNRFNLLSDLARKNGLREITEIPNQMTAGLGKNIALKSATRQSSYHQEDLRTPYGAVDGTKTGQFGFHTQYEENPWWMIDLGEPKTFDDIIVYNRLDGPCRSRARSLCLRISDDGAGWTELYVHNGLSFGGIDGLPLHIRCPRTKARFVLFQLNEANYLHLDQVEIYSATSA